jgi:hypothetical protein
MNNTKSKMDNGQLIVTDYVKDTNFHLTIQ